MATEEWELLPEEDAAAAYDYDSEFDLENPFTSPADEPIASLLDAEGHHAPSVSAATSAARRDAVAFISKVRFGGELAVHPRVAYLALNYVDRFLSKRQLAREQQPWPRLLALSCLSLAAKMQRVATFSIDEIQKDEEFMYDAVTVRRMERLVLSGLEWRARSVTPLAFLGFFLSSCYPPPRHPAQVAAVKARAVDLLFRAQPEVKMAEFSPSVVAASALLAAAGEVAAANLPAFQAGVSACPFVNSEKLRQCGEALAAACGVGPGRADASADTPVTVLGHHRSVSSTSESDWTTGSATATNGRGRGGGDGGGGAKKRCMGPPSQWG